MSVSVKQPFGSELSNECLVFCGLLLLTVLLRVPFANNIGEDEAFFAIIGRDWSLGALPYIDRFDVKPPGLFLIYALASPFFGAGVVPIKGLEIAFVAVSAYGLWRIGRDHFSRPIGIAAAALYPLYSLVVAGGNAPPVTLFVNAFEVYAVLAALGTLSKGEEARRGAALSGFLFGCAFTIKQTAAIEACAVFVALLLEAPSARARLRWSANFCLAGAIAPLGFVAYFFEHGQFAAFWNSAVIAAGGRLGGDNVGFFEGLMRLPGGFRPMLAPLCGAVLALLRLPALFQGPLARPLRVCLGWLIGALIAVIAMRAMYDHYFLPLIAPLLLLAGVAIFKALDFGAPARARIFQVTLVATAALSPLVIGVDSLREGGEDRVAMRGIEQAALVAGLKPGEPALVVNRGVMFYNETGATPATRVFHPQHLLCDFPALEGDVLAQAMEGRPQFVLVANTMIGMVCEKANRLEELKGALRRDYELVAHVSGDWDSYDLYRRQKKNFSANF